MPGIITEENIRHFHSLIMTEFNSLRKAAAPGHSQADCYQEAIGKVARVFDQDPLDFKLEFNRLLGKRMKTFPHPSRRVRHVAHRAGVVPMVDPSAERVNTTPYYVNPSTLGFGIKERQPSPLSEKLMEYMEKMPAGTMLLWVVVSHEAVRTVQTAVSYVATRVLNVEPSTFRTSSINAVYEGNPAWIVKIFRVK